MQSGKYVVVIESATSKAWTKALLSGDKVALYVQGANQQAVERLNKAVEQMQESAEPGVLVIAPPGVEHLLVDVLTIKEIRSG